MLWLILLAILAFAAYVYLNPKEGGVNAPTESSHKTILPVLPDIAEDDNDDHHDAASARAFISGSVESLDWLNDITKICWPHICRIVEKELGPTVEPLVNAALPKPLKNFQFVKSNLGKDCVVVDRVVVHKRYKDAVALDLDVTFKGRPDISMKASFIDHPTLEIEFSGAASIADLAPVERIIRKVVRDVLASMLVLPNRFLYKISDAVDYFDVYYPPTGALLVSVVRGRGFEKEKKAKFVKLTPDCYTKLKFGLEKAQTSVVKKSLTPEWNFSHIFVLSDMEQPLVLKTMDHDPVQDDILGEVTVLARELVEEKERWLSFEKLVDQTVAANAQILVKSELLAFTDNYAGPCMVSILIDRISALPRGTRTSLCRIKVGNTIQKETYTVTRPVEPVPGVDPENPIFNLSYDVIVPSVRDGNVSLTVIADKESAGEVNFNALELTTNKNSVEGQFKLKEGALIRAKVILRGLTPGR